MEMILKLFTTLQSKIKQFIKNHIIDECPKEYDDIFQLMETINMVIMGICFGICVVVGMYITTQISEWIDNQIKK